MSHKNITASEALRLFSDAIYQNIGAVINPIPDGKVHRFDDPEGKQNNGACWYILHLDGFHNGRYGNWRNGEEFTWRDIGATYTPRDRALIRAKSKVNKARREQATCNAQARAADHARQYWNTAVPASTDHPYLLEKRIKGSCLRQIGNELIVPLRDISNRIVNLQHIMPNFSKKFLPGGRITGCFALIARAIPEDGEIYIAEGFATASTIAFSRKVPTIAAMSAGNLKPVAQTIRGKYPHLKIIIAADNDHLTADNMGLAKGREAAAAVGGTLIWPPVCNGSGCSCTDFNDTAGCKRLGQ